MPSKLLRKLLFFAGVLLAVDSLYLSFASNLNFGTLLTFLLGAFLMGYALLDKFLKKGIPVWIKSVFWSLALLLVAFCLFLFSYGHRATVSYEEDVLLVLGAGIRGETPSLSLRYRLDKALEYHKKNPKALIVVSGGQGPQEDISESLAMERYLLERGLPVELILQEDMATNTYENFSFSKKIVDEYFSEPYSLAYITNNYHVLRSRGLARKSGFEKIGHLGAPTPLRVLLPSYMRECAALIKYAIWRS